MENLKEIIVDMKNEQSQAQQQMVELSKGMQSIDHHLRSI